MHLCAGININMYSYIYLVTTLSCMVMYDPYLWDTLARRRDHIQTHTTQQEDGPIAMGYTSA
jgi:hypothetical protein